LKIRKVDGEGEREVSLFEEAARVCTQLRVDFGAPSDEERPEPLLIVAFERVEKLVSEAASCKRTRRDRA
jgi:hypothetical protein